MAPDQKDKKPTPEDYYNLVASLLNNMHLELAKGPQEQLKAFSILFGAYLAILDQCPDDPKALRGLYRVALLFTASPPKLPEIMSRVRAHYEQRLEANPNDAQACIAICQTEKILHGVDTDKGMEWVERALKIDPNNSDAHLELCYQYERHGKKKEARKEVEFAIQLDPHNADAYACRAFMLINTDKVAGFREYRKCYDEDPTHLQAIVMLRTLEIALKGKTG